MNDTSDNTVKDDNLERQVIAQGITEIVKELRRARRMRLFGRVLILAFIFFVLFSSFESDKTAKAMRVNHTGLVNIRGIITDKSKANADNVARALRKAF